MQSYIENSASDSSKSNSKGDSTGFLKTDGGKTKSNSIDIPSISLPKGGGAIKGIDEKFSVNAANGTSSFSVPLPFSPSRGVSPSLSLSYNSGSGNGVFGLGWDISLPTIKRKSDKKLPQYLDEIDSDTFIFSEAEDLVPEFKKAADGSFSVDPTGEFIIKEKDSADNLFTIRFYKPRTEGLFARIERWSHKSSNEIKWRIITKENITTLFGWSANSRLSDTDEENKIYEWLPEFVFDDKGNCSRYIYKPEDEKGFDTCLLHNRNRLRNGNIVYKNLYLEKIHYGNKTPYKQFGDPIPGDVDFLFSSVLDYGTLKDTDPVDKINDWDFRTDAFSDYKAGFEIRTTRLCKRILFYHHFTGANEYDGLVKSLNFEYTAASHQDLTFLKSATEFGYIKQQNDTYTQKKLPAMEFEYQEHSWNKEVKTISPEDLIHAPAGLDAPQYQFVDLYNEGLSGILTEQGNGWYYKHNLGDGKFAQATLVTPKPSFIGLGNRLQLADLDADGGKQLVSLGPEPKGYFELNDDDQWQPFRNFAHLPNINFDDANTRMLDLNGDGKPEILISGDNIFTWYSSEGRNGFGQSLETSKPFEEEQGPHMVFADQEHTIFLADMTGSGVADIVRIRNGEICYWPNLGYAKFGAKVGMDNAPYFDYPDSFDPAYLRLADIDGSGTADILYLGKDKFVCWMNLSGNSFSAVPFQIDAFPEVHNQSKITVTDLLGNGVACIVWSSELSKDSQTCIKYIDLMNSKKPHIMVSYKNNMGKEVTMSYKSSIAFYLEDKKAGVPWVTKLPFPVHCIASTEIRDKITGSRFISSYKYHHGYYDHPEREFRGFGMVEQTDTEHFEDWIISNSTNIVDNELHQEPVVSKTWFHTGSFLSREKILDQFAHEFWYEEMNRQGFPALHFEEALPDAKLVPDLKVNQKLIDHLSAQEWREALRACKGMILRSEVFAKDAAKNENTTQAIIKELTPFSVATHNCLIELIQPKGNNKYAVFALKESEAITYTYERNPHDPRIAHHLNISINQYGNVLESASIVYPRFIEDDSLPPATRKEQNKAVITYIQNRFTNDFTNDALFPDLHRLPLPSETKTFELKGVSKANTYYAPGDFKKILDNTHSSTAEYFELNKPLIPGKAQRRLIENIRSTYYQNNLAAALPLGRLESLAIPFESYQLAYSPQLVADIFSQKADKGLLLEGKFTNSEGDDNWWIRSGTAQYIGPAENFTDAQNRFYLPLSFTDPYGTITKVRYDPAYLIFIEETQDDFGNISKVEKFSFRLLSAQQMKDINGNLSEAITDELGLVKALAIFGKGNEADDLTGLTEATDLVESRLVTAFLDAPLTAEGVTDSVTMIALGKQLLQHATSRFVYDFEAYKNSGKPAVVASISREEHFLNNNDSRVQLSFEYSNGMGSTVMKKVQADPGMAKSVIIHNDDSYEVVNTDTAAGNPKLLRWIGKGKTVMNNKGNAVKQYEPYFSVNHHYEDLKELVETGFTSMLYYDAPGRLIKTKMPDETFTRVEFDSWKQIEYDANDTILESPWYFNRINRLIDAELLAAGKDPVKEKQAAEQAAKLANTPITMHFDTLGRSVLSVQHNKNITTEADEYYFTSLSIDAEGNLRQVTDDRGNAVAEYKFDMLGKPVYQKSMDAGQRWLLVNILGKPLRTWDERNHTFQYFYDRLHRPTISKVLGGDGVLPLDHIFDRLIYGEEQFLPGRSNEEELQAKNSLGQVLQHYDTGGLIDTPEFDFKGQPLFTTRRLFNKFKETANWTDNNLISDLESQPFTFTTEIDALGRTIKQVAPDGSIFTPTYNEGGMLNSETILHLGDVFPTRYIKNIDYNENGQRNRITYGNNVITKFFYDEQTFRLKHLLSQSAIGEALQDWHYTFDPVGNITHIEDKVNPVKFYQGQVVSAIAEYTYDALYRLVKAKGRENRISLGFDNKDNWNDAPFMQALNPGDPIAMHNYTQSYQYDSVGNIKQMKHRSKCNDWTRNYSYENINNRLKTTAVGSVSYQYTYNSAHGYMTVMPHLEVMGWNFKEELIKTVRQKRLDGGTAETTWYQYDSSGQRIRKITENQAAPSAIPTLKDERIYIAGYEMYKNHNGTGLERINLSLLDKGYRFVTIESRNEVDDGSEKHLVRYQLTNHQGSATLELDHLARVITYEEYHPFGTTAFQARNALIKSVAKRYRYTGVERDEETGLEYHSARYYLPWLARWISADPAGLDAGINYYQYCSDNPIGRVDLNGKYDWGEVAIGFIGAVAVVAVVVVVATVAAPVLAAAVTYTAATATAVTGVAISDAAVVTTVTAVGTAYGIRGVAQTTDQIQNGATESERSRALGRLPVEVVATALGARGLFRPPPTIPGIPKIEYNLQPGTEATFGFELTPAAAAITVPVVPVVAGSALNHMMVMSGGGGSSNGGGSNGGGRCGGDNGDPAGPPEPLSSVDPEGEPFTDPAQPDSTPGYYPSRPVDDHVLSRAIARRLGRLPEALDPENIDVKTWEANARKGGFEGNYLRELKSYIQQGLTEEQAMDVLQGELDYITNDVIARPIDSLVIGNELASPAPSAEDLLISLEEDPVCR